MPEIGMRNAVYLFCIARSGLLPAIEGKGLDGRSSLFLHRWRDITAVACFVEIQEFCGPAAELRLQDIFWVGSRACRHEEVVEQVMRCSPVLPVRFGTIFSSPEKLEKRLREHHDKISAFLDEVVDKEEWAVKGLLDRTKARGEIRVELVAGRAEYLASLSPGIRYLHEQRILANAEEGLRIWLTEVSGEIAGVLNSCALNFSQRRVLSRDVTGDDREMLLNWAFLVARSCVGDLRAAIDRVNGDHARRGLVFILSGPWPPYSFSPSLETGVGT
jgi:hypothetical protein